MTSKPIISKWKHKVKIFTGSSTVRLEDKINKWLDENDSICILDIENISNLNFSALLISYTIEEKE